MNTNIINAAPMSLSLGTKDSSTRALPYTPEQIPTNLPKIYLYTPKGPTGPQLVVGNSRNQMYGDGAFEEGSKFFNHQSKMSNVFNDQGNAQMIERMLPADIGPKANFLLSADVLVTTNPVYQRDGEGKYIVDDVTGLPVPATPASTVPGLKIKWVVTSITTKTQGQVDSDLFGIASSAIGDQTEASVTSMRYPIAQFWAGSEGGIFNLSGLKIWAPNENSGVKTDVIRDMKVYPFRLSAMRKDTELSTAKIVQAEDGSATIDFTLKPNVKYAAMGDAQFSLADIYQKRYSNTTDVRYPTKYADLHNLKLYDANVATLLGLIYSAEKDLAAAGTDFDVTRPDEEQKWLVNPFTARSSSGAPYYSVVIDTASPTAVSLIESTTIYAKGGSDGTMSDALFDGLVANAVAEYANENSPLLNTARNVESSVWDSGFGLNTKYAYCKALAERVDMGVVLGTAVAGGVPLDASSDNSIAVALRARVRNYPESPYFGTPAMRAIIVGRSGLVRNSTYTKRLPLTHELADKFAKMMGAGDGRWKAEALFDSGENNIINQMYDISTTYVPQKQRNLDWDAGLTVVADFDRSRQYFPAVHTVYDNDTSVLTSAITVWGAIELQKVAERVHRRLTGSIRYTEAQFCKRAEEMFNEMTVGRFANLFKIVPRCTIVGADEQRGYSWTLKAELYGNNAKTVQTFYVDAWRMSSYSENNS
jgi:hypothetical protein